MALSHSRSIGMGGGFIPLRKRWRGRRPGWIDRLKGARRVLTAAEVDSLNTEGRKSERYRLTLLGGIRLI